MIRHDLQRVLKVLEFHFDALKSLKTIQTTCLGKVLSLEFHFFPSSNTEIKTWNHCSVARMNFTSNKYCNIPFLYCWPGCLKCVFHETSFDDSYGKSVKRSLKVWKVWSRPMFCLKSFTIAHVHVLKDFCWILDYIGEIKSTNERKEIFLLCLKYK